ncbi:uncharacterized protein [Haliotis asinina]|uniref:uncharacterized protein n=1 Tax=Haliotis asinina TaxID=109174 RepID=UPI0035319AC4
MEQMNVEEKKMNAANRPLFIGFLLVVLLLLVSVALTSLLVHRSQTSQVRTKEPTLRERFPGYFRYPAEQEAFEKLGRPSTPMTSFPNVTRSTVSQQCSALLPSPTAANTQSEESLHHACCITTTTFPSPDYLEDVLGVNRTIAVFRDQIGFEAKQFIRKESCTQPNGCDFCNCSTTTTYVTLVWQSGLEYGVSWFAVDGCCKCFNV